MRIHHLILGVENLQISTDFYVRLLGFEFETEFTDTGNQQKGHILTYQDATRNPVQVLLVPYPPERVPNPRHLAFEVEPSRFETVYRIAKQMGLKTRADSPRDYPHEGIGHLETGGQKYRNFFVFDPNGANLEVLAQY